MLCVIPFRLLLTLLCTLWCGYIAASLDPVEQDAQWPIASLIDALLLAHPIVVRLFVSVDLFLLLVVRKRLGFGVDDVIRREIK